MADLARQGPLADHANKRARHLVESWVVRGDGDETRAEGRRGGEAEGTAVVARDTGGGRDDEERGHPQSLGLLLALCGLDEDAKALLGGFEAPASWPLLSALPSSAANDVVATAVASVEGRREEDIWAEPGEEQAREGGDAAPKGSELPSSVPLGAVAEAAAENATAFTATAAAGTPPAAYSLLDYEEAAKGEKAAVGVEAGNLPKAAERQEQDRREQPPAKYFDDEADFLEKSASEYAELMADQDEDEEYLSEFSFAPPPGFAAEAPLSRAAGGVDRMSEADRFRQLQQQQRARLAERQQAGLDEATKMADSRRPSSQPIAAAPVGQAAQRSGVVLSEGTAAGGGRSTSDTSPPRGGEGGEPGIIRRANLLEGGQTIVLIDVETTGLVTKKHRVIQLAGKVLGSQDPRHLYSAYVDPDGAYVSEHIQSKPPWTVPRLGAGIGIGLYRKGPCCGLAEARVGERAMCERICVLPGP